MQSLGGSTLSLGSCVPHVVCAVAPAAGRRGERSYGCDCRWELWPPPRAGLGQTLNREGLPRAGGRGRVGSGPDQESPSASRAQVLSLDPVGMEAVGSQSWAVF